MYTEVNSKYSSHRTTKKHLVLTSSTRSVNKELLHASADLPTIYVQGLTKLLALMHRIRRRGNMEQLRCGDLHLFALEE
jgi:hypothetical protein